MRRNSKIPTESVQHKKLYLSSVQKVTKSIQIALIQEPGYEKKFQETSEVALNAIIESFEMSIKLIYLGTSNPVV